ncbi:hypothetical protein HY251_17010, partial [bacterium]|nr:hypothetical protein [bacterium]
MEAFEPREPRANVLLADEPARLGELEETLAPLGARLIRASCGREALAQLKRREHALFIIAVELTGLDGFETARIARENGTSSRAPVIFLTAREPDGERLARASALGGELLKRPFPAEALRAKARMLIDLSRRSALLDGTRERLERRSAELERALAAAERESELRSRFLARISHELRTPLNAIIGFSELLGQETLGPLAPKQKEYVATVLESGRHLLEVVNDVLDLSRLQAGKLELFFERTSVPDLVASARGIAAPLAEKQGIALEVAASGELPHLNVDPRRIREVLVNLLANAVKFTPRGGRVSLAARAGG